MSEPTPWGESSELDRGRVNGHAVALLRRLPPRPKVTGKVAHFMRRLPPRPRLIVERIYLQGYPQWLVALEVGVQQPTVSEMLAGALGHMQRWATLPLDPLGPEVERIVGAHLPGTPARFLGLWWERLNTSEVARELDLWQSMAVAVLDRVERHEARRPDPAFKKLQEGVTLLRAGPALRWHPLPPARAVAPQPARQPHR